MSISTCRCSRCADPTPKCQRCGAPTRRSLYGGPVCEACEPVRVAVGDLEMRGRGWAAAGPRAIGGAP